MHPSTYEYLKPTDEPVAQMARVRAAAKAYSEIFGEGTSRRSRQDFQDPRSSLKCNVGQRCDHATSRRNASRLTANGKILAMELGEQPQNWSR